MLALCPTTPLYCEGTYSPANLRNKIEMTPVHLASSIAVLDVLYQHDADMQALDCNRRTPLFIACAMNREECSDFLISMIDHTSGSANKEGEELLYKVGNATLQTICYSSTILHSSIPSLLSYNHYHHLPPYVIIIYHHDYHYGIHRTSAVTLPCMQLPVTVPSNVSCSCCSMASTRVLATTVVSKPSTSLSAIATRDARTY